MINLLANLDPLHHVVDRPMWGSEKFFGFPVLTSVGVIIVSGIVTIYLMMRAARAIATGSETEGTERYIARTRLSQLVETIVLGLRDQMLVPVMGHKQANRYLSFLLSLFFFLLVINFFGLIPFGDAQRLLQTTIGIPLSEDFILFGGAATANLMVTGGLAAVCFVVIQVHSVRELGLWGWMEHLCGGRDITRGSKGLYLVIPIIFIVEFFGLFIKPAALAIRLFANMVGGHTLLATLLMFGAMGMQAGLSSYAITGISFASVIFGTLILLLEIFVAFLQAFIFMFLTAVFISQMSHSDEHEDSLETVDTAEAHH